MTVSDDWLYQLVIQFHLDDADMARFEAVIQFESDLEDWLRADSEVEGHDAGSGEMNIFIHTNDPPATLRLVQALLPRLGAAADGYSAGYRRFSEDEYTPLWPAGLANFDVI
jgi:hypothetical protein